jgi:hypothetical protein
MTRTNGSRLVLVGMLLMLLAVSVPMTLERLLDPTVCARHVHTTQQTMSAGLVFVIDGLGLGFFVGLALVIIGLPRNPRSKKIGGQA